MNLPEHRFLFRASSRRMRAVSLTAILTIAAAGGVARAKVRFSESPAQPRALAVGMPRHAKVARPITPVAVKSPPKPDWDIANIDHPRVDYWIEEFTTDKRDEFTRFLQRSGRYTPMISAKLKARGMPQDLIYLAMIESGFNPTAYSRANASGLWQFIAATARRYDLDINRAVDERNDPVKSTDAALDYLSELHDRFGSWYLAAAGYNTGENRISRIMRQVTGSERGTEASYYEIWNRLPRETRDYVPLMIAAARISKDPARYGFGDVDIESPMQFDEVRVEPATPLAAIADAAGTTVATIHKLNPQLKLDRTRNDQSSTVRIPDGSAQRFAAHWPEARKSEKYAKADVLHYRVRRGDNLTKIARRHGVTIAQLRRANGIRGDLIRAGTVLTIPT